MPTTATDILIDIDGYSEADVQWAHCMREYYSNDLCTSQFWPNNYTAGRSSYCQAFFTEHGMQIQDPSQFQSVLMQPTSQPMVASNWITPDNDIQIHSAFVHQIAGLVTANANEVIIKRVFWAGVGFNFINPPTYQLSNAAVTSGNYIVSTNPNTAITTNTTQAVLGSNAIPIDDPEGIIPGMIMSSVNTVSNTGGGITYPYVGKDVRVISYPYTDAQGYIFVNISDEQDLNNNEILTFQPYDDSGNTITKEFTTILNPTNHVGCPNGLSQPTEHAIHYLNTLTMQTDIIHGSGGATTPSSIVTPTGTSIITSISPTVTSVSLGSFARIANNLPSSGGAEQMRIMGSPSAVYNVQITNNAGNTFNFDTLQFTSTNTTSGDIEIGPTGLSTLNFNIPSVTSDDEYSIKVIPKNGSVLGDNIPKTIDTFKLKQQAKKTITFDTAGTGLTIASTLDTTFSGKSNKQADDGSVLTNFSITGAITKSGPAILYINRQPDIDYDDGGDFTNSRNLEKTVSSINGKAVVLNNVTNISTGFVAYGDNITENVTVSSISGNIVILSSAQPLIKNDQKIRFSKGGHHVEIDSAVISGQGTTSLTATIRGRILRFGSENTTITFALDNFVSSDPKAYNGEVTCSISDAVVDIDLTVFDHDTNMGDKTYSLVSGEGPSKGSLGGYGGSGSAFDSNRVRYTHTGPDSDTGSTDTFSYKATVGSDAGDATAEYGTITINLID